MQASCTIHGHFAPQADGSLTAVVAVIDDAANSPQLIELSGTGTGAAAPAATLSATSLSYGTVSIGESSASQQVILTATGGPLAISSILVTGADASSFVFANSCPATLASDASCIIHGHFAPTVTGALTATVVILDDAGNSPQTITLSGTGQ
jgi:hypothetical protein